MLHSQSVTASLLTNWLYAGKRLRFDQRTDQSGDFLETFEIDVEALLVVEKFRSKLVSRIETKQVNDSALTKYFQKFEVFSPVIHRVVNLRSMHMHPVFRAPILTNSFPAQRPSASWVFVKKSFRSSLVLPKRHSV